jgi:CheY-like chemotaxis protein
MLVLYVEDNPVNVELVRTALQRLPEVRLEVAVDGPGGLEAARRLCPDLLLLDLDLPGLHGIEVLRRLRTDPATAGIPCVAVSANAMEPDIERARQEGFADYLTKPFRIDRLIALVAAHRRPRAPPTGQS